MSSASEPASSGSPATDSSSSSSDDGPIARMKDFKIDGGRVKAKLYTGGKYKKVVITALQNMPPAIRSNWSKPLDNPELMLAAENWTNFFLANSNIHLTGTLKCANLLRPMTGQQICTIAADAYFPYVSRHRRTYKGYSYGTVPVTGSNNAEKVHLEDDTSQTEVTLEPNLIYFIGSKREPDLLPPTCALCRYEHKLQSTPCRTQLRFLPLPSHRHLLKRICDIYEPGERILTIIPGRKSEISFCGLHVLCPDCRQLALEQGNRWKKMDGSCKKLDCPNRYDCECDSSEEEEEDKGLCSHYFYMRECNHNNLPEDDIAVAIAEGNIKTVEAAWNGFSLTGCLPESSGVRKFAMKKYKRGEPVSVETLLAMYSTDTYQLDKEELLAFAIEDSRLGDYLKENKCFTLSKINGFIENPNMARVGPWLEGRLTRDEDGTFWHVPKCERVHVTTIDGVSHVRKLRESELPRSDELGTFIAGLQK